MTLPVTNPIGVPAAGNKVNGLVLVDPRLAAVMSTAPYWLPA